VVSTADPLRSLNLSFLLFFPVAPHLSSQGLSEPCSRPTATQKMWQHRKSNPGPLGLQPGSLTTRSQRRSKYAEKTFLNRQLGMKVYTKLVMIMELE
jgi:hypothetical protein